ncbi:MAG TPA: transcriptional activator RfaH [Hyphomicrobiaceae bacterium]|nr:transcriptional activator RfaH [Hyphomicrobiaceae bacterium]
MMRWFAVNSLPHQESRAETNLARQGFQAFLPRLRKARSHARRADVVLEAMFPGYLFVSFAEESTPWRSINGTYGVRSIIMGGGRPAPLPRGFCEELLAQADADGVVAVPSPEFHVGDRVSFVSGPLTGRIGTIIRLGRRERVELLLCILSGEIRIDADRHQLSLAR